MCLNFASAPPHALRLNSYRHHTCVRAWLPFGLVARVLLSFASALRGTPLT